MRNPTTLHAIYKMRKRHGIPAGIEQRTGVPLRSINDARPHRLPSGWRQHGEVRRPGVPLVYTQTFGTQAAWTRRYPAGVGR